MFNGLPQGASQIAQGATLLIFNRKEFNVERASVLNVSQPHMSKAAASNPAMALQGFVIDLTVSLNGDTTTIEFPVNSISANYPDKGWFVSPDAPTVAREVESMVNLSKQALTQVPMHERIVKMGGPLLLQLNPEKKVEAEQAEKIASLESQLAAMNGKFDQLVSLLSAGRPANTNKKKEE